ncbi:hypothetical protein AB205_0201290 [Aquarana catesbeiana]|uniref:Alpha-macroglobulin-like TED domain-containing protein n=1 Tax=Aquarana catesbeiana TaxID=8400 RepID=A0A2G9S8P4_AQUCT|nr:hypothetical protein AB205_0201290 [Aquarana catesbeiana]
MMINHRSRYGNRHAINNNHWQEPNSHQLSLEATSYALLALVRMEEFDKSAPVVRWLTEQRFYGEVWGATQSTIMIFESIAKYYQDAPTQKELEMDVFFKLPGRSAGTKIRLNRQNALNARSDQTQMGGDFVVTATGKGQGSLSAFSVYYAIETEKEKQCKNFDLTLTVQDEPLAEPLLTSGIPSGAHSYIRCAQRSPSLHQVSRVEPLLTSGAPPYIWCPQRSPSIHQVSPAEPPPYIWCPQWSSSLHLLSPAAPILTSGVPSGAPPYIR